MSQGCRRRLRASIRISPGSALRCIPESIRADPDPWLFFQHFLHDARPGAFTPQDIERYVEAWSQQGAATAMINYYRASVRRSPKRTEAQRGQIQVPTLVIWGQRDRYLSPN